MVTIYTNADFHIIFLFQLSRHLGFYPQNNCVGERIFFNLISGQFKEHFGDPDIYLDREVSELWNRYMRTDLQRVKEEVFNGSQRKIILDKLVRYYKLHVTGMGEIRSLEILHSYFVK